MKAMPYGSGGPLGSTHACAAIGNPDAVIYSSSKLYRLSAQSDQNLVLYDEAKGAIWTSNTLAKGSDPIPVELAMQEVT